MSQQNPFLALSTEELNTLYISLAFLMNHVEEGSGLSPENLKQEKKRIKKMTAQITEAVDQKVRSEYFTDTVED